MHNESFPQIYKIKIIKQMAKKYYVFCEAKNIYKDKLEYKSF